MVSGHRTLDQHTLNTCLLFIVSAYCTPLCVCWRTRLRCDILAASSFTGNCQYPITSLPRRVAIECRVRTSHSCTRITPINWLIGKAREQIAMISRMRNFPTYLRILRCYRSSIYVNKLENRGFGIRHGATRWFQFGWFQARHLFVATACCIALYIHYTLLRRGRCDRGDGLDIIGTLIHLNRTLPIDDHRTITPLTL